MSNWRHNETGDNLSQNSTAYKQTYPFSRRQLAINSTCVISPAESCDLIVVTLLFKKMNWIQEQKVDEKGRRGGRISWRVSILISRQGCCLVIWENCLKRMHCLEPVRINITPLTTWIACSVLGQVFSRNLAEMQC